MALAQLLEGMRDRLARQQTVERPVEAEIGAAREDLQRRLVEQQDAAIGGAGDQAVRQVAQHRLEPALLLAGAGAGGGERGLLLGLARAPALGQRVDRRHQLAEAVARRHGERPVGPGVEQELDLARQRRDRPHPAVLEQQPDERLGAEQRQTDAASRAAPQAGRRDRRASAAGERAAGRQGDARNRSQRRARAESCDRGRADMARMAGSALSRKPASA